MAMQALSNSKFDEAPQSFGEAVKLDPNFGLAYAGMAIASSNMGQPQEADDLRAGGHPARRQDDRARAVPHPRHVLLHRPTTTRHASRSTATCWRATTPTRRRATTWRCARPSCATWTGRARRCSASSQILPKRSLYRVNAALYSAYASDFPWPRSRRGWPRSCRIPGRCRRWPWPSRGRARPPRPSRAIEALASVPGAGPPYTASGLGDVALYEGRFADAASPLHRRRQGRPGRQGRRSRRRQVRGAGLHRAGPRPAAAGPGRGRAGARQQHRQCRSASSPRGSTRRPARSPRPRRSPRGSAPSCRPSRRPTARSSTA